MKSGSEIKGGGGGRLNADGFNKTDERVTDVADGMHGVAVLATHEQHTARRQAMQVDAAVGVLLDDFQAVASARAAAKLGGSSQRRMREHQNCGSGRLTAASAGQQTTSVIGDGSLQNARNGGQS